MKGSHAIVVLFASILCLEILHRCYLAQVNNHDGNWSECLHDRCTFLTPLTDYILSQASSAIRLIAVGGAIVACIRADELLSPARVLLCFSLSFSTGHSSFQAMSGYFANCMWSLYFSLFIDALTLIGFSLMFVAVVENEELSITSSSKCLKSSNSDKAVYSSVPVKIPSV
ncbi:hypothetical protein PFISCL1PPCAC_2986 [Pristionchus fissidentatus]|uniref:G protein-coupled receptor n=1 Tax=Pristionchus fissidentatus TaxID=1538716 RepID=A0AAV5UX62_9BILA|nr:hypothetical protein PFISCL1PPCAC_2986 [Pristionchus fissidentatus]